MPCKYRDRITKFVYREAAASYGRKREHVVVAERALGKTLPRGAEVHHVNGNGLDNRNENLVICENQAYHKLLHRRARLRAIGADLDRDWICCRCRQARRKEQFTIRRSGPYAGGIAQPCKQCHRELARVRKTRPAVPSGLPRGEPIRVSPSDLRRLSKE